MGFLDKAKEKALAATNAVKDAKAKDQIPQEVDPSGVLLKLTSIDKRLLLFHDHLELRNLTGSKSESIPYSQIRSVGVKKHSALGKGTAAVMTAGMSLAVTNKKILLIETGPTNLELEFRMESPSTIDQAIEIIKAGMAQASNPNVTVTVAGSDGTASKADELKKLAQLRADGILTEDEFQAEKVKLLS